MLKYTVYCVRFSQYTAAMDTWVAKKNVTLILSQNYMNYQKKIEFKT